MGGTAYVVKALIRKRILLWVLIAVALLTAVPAAINSTLNYVSLYVEATTKVVLNGSVTNSLTQAESVVVKYLIINLSKDGLTQEATLACPKNLSEYINYLMSASVRPEVSAKESGNYVLITQDLSEELGLKADDSVNLSLGGGKELLNVGVGGIINKGSLIAVGSKDLCSEALSSSGNGVVEARTHPILFRRVLTINSVLAEGLTLLNIWVYLSTLVLFALSATLTAALINEFRFEGGVLHSLGMGRKHLVIGLVTASLIISLCGAGLGASAGLVIAQATFKAGYLLNFLAGLKPYLRYGDFINYLVINTASVVIASTLTSLMILRRDLNDRL